MRARIKNLVFTTKELPKEKRFSPGFRYISPKDRALYQEILHMFQKLGRVTDDRQFSRFTPCSTTKYVNKELLQKVREQKCNSSLKGNGELRIIPVFGKTNVMVVEEVEEMPCELIDQLNYSYLNNY